MLTVKYFAYGSNINLERLKNRIESFNSQKVYRGEPFVLRDYALIFNAGMEFGTFSYANIVPQRGAKVEGVLYEITPEQFRRLDQYELFYEKQYFQIDEDTIACTYVAKEGNTTKKEVKPDLNYLNTIIDGCLEEGLTATYNALVKYKTKNYKLKKGNKHKFYGAIQT